MATDREYKLLAKLFPEDKELDALVDALGIHDYDKLAEYVADVYDNKIKPDYIEKFGRISKSQAPAIANAIIKNAVEAHADINGHNIKSFDDVESSGNHANEEPDKEHQGAGFVFEKKPTTYEAHGKEEIEDAKNRVTDALKRIKNNVESISELADSKVLSTQLVDAARKYSDYTGVKFDTILRGFASMMGANGLQDVSTNTLHKIKRNAGMINSKDESYSSKYIKSEAQKAADRKTPADAFLEYLTNGFVPAERRHAPILDPVSVQDENIRNYKSVSAAAKDAEQPLTAIWKRKYYKPATYWLEKAVRNGKPSIQVWDTMNPFAQTDEWKNLSTKEQDALLHSDPFKYIVKNGRNPLAIFQGRDPAAQAQTIMREDLEKDGKIDKNTEDEIDMTLDGEYVPGYSITSDGMVRTPDGRIFDEDYNEYIPAFDAEGFKQGLNNIEFTKDRTYIDNPQTYGMTNKEKAEYAATRRHLMNTLVGRDLDVAATTRKDSPTALHRLLATHGFVVGPDNKIYLDTEALSRMAPKDTKDKLQWALDNTKAVPSAEERYAGIPDKGAAMVMELQRVNKEKAKIQKILDSMGIPYDPDANYAIVTRAQRGAASGSLKDKLTQSIAKVNWRGEPIDVVTDISENGKYTPEVRQALDKVANAEREANWDSMEPEAAAMARLRYKWSHMLSNDAKEARKNNKALGADDVDYENDILEAAKGLGYNTEQYSEVPLLDKYGKPMYEDELDEEGNPVYEDELDEEGNPVYEDEPAVDASGRPIIGEDGKQRVNKVKKQKQKKKQKTTKVRRDTKEYDKFKERLTKSAKKMIAKKKTQVDESNEKRSAKKKDKQDPYLISPKNEADEKEYQAAQENKAQLKLARQMGTEKLPGLSAEQKKALEEETTSAKSKAMASKRRAKDKADLASIVADVVQRDTSLIDGKKSKKKSKDTTTSDIVDALNSFFPG